MRIVSLLASATEIVCALDAGGQLVGRSHECDNPAWVRSLPACSEPAFDVSVSSGAIDREVNRRIRSGEPLYRIDAGRIRALAADLIIAQSHCEVCAVTPGDVERSGGPIRGARILSLAASTLDEIFASILEVARALDLEQRGLALVAGERERLERLRSASAAFRRSTVAVIEWTDPLFPMCNWGPELVEIANGELVLGDRNQHSAAVPAHRLRAADPEYVIIAPCGFSLERTAQELPVLEQYSWWSGLSAVRSGKVAFCDGNLFFNRSGMTISRTAEIVGEVLHGLVSGVPSEGLHWRWLRDLPV